MTEQEQKDLKEMLTRIQEIKIKTYDHARFCARLTTEELRFSGHKTVESAVLSTVKSGMKEIEKLETAHYTKYPD